MYGVQGARVYPTPDQAAVLNRTFGCGRLVWNRTLAWRQHRYRADGATTSYAQSDRYLTELKRDPEFGFLFDVLLRAVAADVAAPVHGVRELLRRPGSSPGTVSSR
ncbi:helix-turn-helix domain-containing protein [Nonomuraea sp. NPDC000554]|uniref:helix-turn-helix domain-containing protein n=1 Tax=Nonomuraea sp. NPDC000554 TaxID=3154259 RepID=UPI003334A43C